jgi:hypothetical protein
LVIGAASPATALTDPQRARAAVGYLASQQKSNGSIPAFSPIGSTADAVVSMVAAGFGQKNVNRAMRYLAGQAATGNVTGVGLEAKVAMAAVASGHNPRNLGGVNLVLEIRLSEQPDGRYGASTPVFEDALAMLALAAASITPDAKATAWLASAQCADGGWQYDQPSGPNDDQHCQDTVAPGSDFYLSDTNTTSLAVQALRLGSGSATPDADPFAFFSALRDQKRGGWGYTWGFQTTDANSTALVIQALVAENRAVPSGAAAALRALQYGCGAFAYSWQSGARTGPNVGATIGAILGLLRRPLPVAADPVTNPAPAPVACA